MRILVAVIYAESPILIRRRRSPRGFEAVENTIPGSTLAGALLDALSPGSEGYKLVANGYAVADAYPVVYLVDEADGKYRPSMPAPPVTLTVKKVKEDLKPEVISCPLVGRSAKEVYERLYSHWERMLGYYPVGLVKRIRQGTPIAPLLHYPIRDAGLKDCFAAKKVNVEPSDSYDSVAISPARGNAEKEMLFTYYALPRGTLFWTIISLPDEVEPRGECIEARLGGGKSRGYGRVRIALKELDKGVLAALREDMEKALHGGHAVYLWSSLPAPPGTALPMLPQQGWSRVLNAPKLSVPSIPPGTLLAPEDYQPHRDRLQDPLAARVQGLAPPRGQAEPLPKENPVPATITRLADTIDTLARKAAKKP